MYGSVLVLVGLGCVCNVLCSVVWVCYLFENGVYMLCVWLIGFVCLIFFLSR